MTSKYLTRAKQKARLLPNRKDKRKCARSILADLRKHLTAAQ